MKKSIYVLLIAAGFAACNTKPKTETTTTTTTVAPDTAGLHAFQEYKDEQRREQDKAIETNGLNSTASTVVATTPAHNNNVGAKERSVAKTTHRTTTATHRASTGSSSSNSGSGTVASAPVPAKKKGWSKAAKGTAIGAGSGAVLGAIISKNKGKGAIIGGVLGAAGGYVIGHGKDKKDGRY